MYISYFPEKDATMYELHEHRNTGIDQIVELSKIAMNSKAPDGTFWDGTFNSRILMQFNLNALSASIGSGDIPSTANYYLKLWYANASNVPITYDVYAYPVSESWSNGDGNLNDKPERKEGVSWRYRTGNVDSLFWNSASLGNNVDLSYQSIQGGGSWYTGSGYEASQSFSFENPDLRMNVTDIVNKWLDGTVDNNGFIIKRTNTDESGSSIKGDLKFFSKETHTVFIPRLEVMWDDSNNTGIGSFTEIGNAEWTVSTRNFKGSYLEGERPRIRIRARDRFPTRTYSTQSSYLNVKRLPTSSYYSVVDYATGDTIIPFDSNATKISCDSNGNYLDLRMDAFLPERKYELILKVEREGGSIINYINDGFIFKVRVNR